MKLPPAAILDSWPTPNYIDPPTRGHGVLIVNVVCLTLASLVVSLRLYTRVWITCSAGIDDALIVIGLVFGIAMAIVTSIATEHWDMNRHIWDIKLLELEAIQKLNLSFQIMFSMSSCFTKISLLWFCRRLIGKGHFALYNLAFIFAIVFVGVASLLFTIISIFQCSPIRAYWQLNPTESYHCMNDGAIVFSASVINIFTDFLVTALPMPLIWSLKLPARQRLAVISIFALGSIVNVAGSVRTVYVWKSMVTGYDATWLGWPVLIAAAVEISLGLICSSAPALRPLIAAFLPRLLSSNHNTTSYNQRSRTHRHWYSTARSRASRLVADGHHQPSYSSDRFEIIRTVEMESWVESRLPSHEKMGHGYDITSDTGRAVTPADSIEMKSGMVYASPTSAASSSASGRSETFDGRQLR
ncbi:hypothetical protein DTO013E5_5203 [Penicillium roqueforti]|uniref:uncharacterized protein n=1 Tax=Penicillium roqueforti TaxID=5082 RepID=UPI00190B1FC7|nr:uncharacterized protein LCP9604111_5548 [Penicillium roqueforti]KAF9248293.1 hypothetical protein LCP9604111_5548 [Penicillium roqueforti]KAI1836151.1 hypothetical protein CBS147337_3300 [Penicillium roqueforti]KAI2680056.1 hypothetical protein LCP963914a_7146 [Penicillium roqueforti]KAI2683174.1 hypothetical protein CBS147355_2314 [Penicillium roqueforti]KAI2701742.1 hypothetical protein CBS147372_4795 [Penicillium roqueforti]